MAREKYELLKLSGFQRQGAKDAKERQEFISHDHLQGDFGNGRLPDFFADLRVLCVESFPQKPLSLRS